MTRLQCIQQIGHPKYIFPKNERVSVKSKEQREIWCYLVERNRLQIELNFNGEECVSCSFMVLPCPHFRSNKERELLIGRLRKDCQSESHTYDERKVAGDKL